MPRAKSLAWFALLAASCATPWARSDHDTHGKPPPVRFLRQEKPTLLAAIEELGAPDRRFVRDRVVTWRLAEGGERCTAVHGAAEATQPIYLLVVEHDDEQAVRHWSLLTLW